MDKFNHFIITRFNIKQAIWKSDKEGNSVNNNKWLENRYDLFLKYCFPSIKNQTCKNFKWFVYFDVDTLQKYKDINAKLGLQFDWFLPLYVKDFRDFENCLHKDIKNKLSDNSKYVITTRLDNDDCFHNQAVEIIQFNFECKKRFIIDLVHGMTLKIGTEFKLGLRRNVRSGPFISLVEELSSSEPLLTVYDREHTSWEIDTEFKYIKGNYYWLQIVHDRNVSNGLSNELTFNKSYLKGYEFLHPIHFNPRYYIFIILKQIKFFKVLKSFKSTKKQEL